MRYSNVYSKGLLDHGTQQLVSVCAAPIRRWLEQPTPDRLTSRTADLIVNPFEIHVSSDLLSTDLPLTPLARVLIF